MKRFRHSLACAVLCAAMFSLSLARPAPGCAPVTGRGGQVTIAGESAVIVWDEKTKTEHFIRRASFQTRVPYFGFLVPSPRQPALAEAPDELFRDLEDWTKPEVVTKTVYRDRGGMFSAGAKAVGMAAMPASVQVLGTQRVAGYDAAILKADDAAALKDWLERHGYVTRPDLETWLEPYVRAGWVITAFQIAKAEKEKDGLSTQAVRMTFQTARPFYPYAEPGDQRGEGAHHPGRLLRIFLVGAARMEGKLDHATTTWPGRAAWSNALPAQRRDQLLRRLGGAAGVSVPEKAWLTVFDDASSPRPGVADLFFSESADQSPLARPPIVRYLDVDLPLTVSWQFWTLVGLGVLLLGAFAVLVWKGLTARGQVS